MKKILSLALSILMLVSLLSLAGCGKKENLKLGLGVYSAVKDATSADADTDGKATASITAAALLLDADGKVVKCAIDTAESDLAFTSKGAFVETKEIKTKYEKGDDYGMVAYGGAKKEWFEQIDALCGLVVGKTLDEIKVLMAADTKGTDEVINAGCTIYISDFIKAIEKAFNNVAESTATADDALKLGFALTASGKNATDEAKGETTIDATMVATALDKDGKITASATDAVTAKVEFDAKGVTETANADLTSKLQAGDNYNMAKYGQDLNGDGKVLEWYAQAAEFNKAVIGKTASDVAALAGNDGYPVSDLQTAGCTINISDFVKAAVKAATVA